MSSVPVEDIPPKKSKAWGNVKIVVGVVAYMLPLFWLWRLIGFPEASSIHITAHGRAGLIENWWYSYLLIQRHRPLDVLCFAYMWAGIIVLFYPLARDLWRSRHSKTSVNKPRS